MKTGLMMKFKQIKGKMHNLLHTVTMSVPKQGFSDPNIFLILMAMALLPKTPFGAAHGLKLGCSRAYMKNFKQKLVKVLPDTHQGQWVLYPAMQFWRSAVPILYWNVRDETDPSPLLIGALMIRTADCKDWQDLWLTSQQTLRPPPRSANFQILILPSSVDKRKKASTVSTSCGHDYSKLALVGDLWTC